MLDSVENDVNCQQSCSQEQPLLLEDLLEQEKREQEKQQQQQQVDTATPSGALLSDSEFERLRADVLGSTPLGSPPQGIPGGGPLIRPPCVQRPQSAAGPNWPQGVPDAVKIVGKVPRQPIATQTLPEREFLLYDTIRYDECNVDYSRCSAPILGMRKFIKKHFFRLFTSFCYGRWQAVVILFGFSSFDFE